MTVSSPKAVVFYGWTSCEKVYSGDILRLCPPRPLDKRYLCVFFTCGLNYIDIEQCNGKLISRASVHWKSLSWTLRTNVVVCSYCSDCTPVPRFPFCFFSDCIVLERKTEWPEVKWNTITGHCRICADRSLTFTLFSLRGDIILAMKFLNCVGEGRHGAGRDLVKLIVGQQLRNSLALTDVEGH